MIDLNNQKRKQEAQWDEIDGGHGYIRHRLWFREKYAGYIAFDEKHLLVYKCINRSVIENPGFLVGEEGADPDLYRSEIKTRHNVGDTDSFNLEKEKREFLEAFTKGYDEYWYENIYRYELRMENLELIERSALEENQWADRWLGKWEIEYLICGPEILRFVLKMSQRSQRDICLTLEKSLRKENDLSAKVIIDSGFNVFSKWEVNLDRKTYYLTFPEIAAAYGRLSVLQHIFQKSPDALDRLGDQCLARAYDVGNQEIIAFLKKKRRKLIPWMDRRWVKTARDIIIILASVGGFVLAIIQFWKS